MAFNPEASVIYAIRLRSALKPLKVSALFERGKQIIITPGMDIF